jgi:ribosomal-protein-alanine N-acetyltransferase
MKMVLSPYHPSFLPAVHRWRNEADSQRFNPLLQVSREETGRYLEMDGCSFEKLSSAPTHRWFFLVGGKPVGTVSLQNISHMMNSAEIGYMVGEEFHGRGFATQGVSLFLDQLFARSAIRRVIALVHEENAASSRVMEKLGFTREGLLREHFIIKGAPVNEIYYGLLKNEWLERRE